MIWTCFAHYWRFGKWKPAVDSLNTLRPRRNEQHFADDIFKRIFFNENVWISIKISLKFVPKGPINNIPALVQIMAWRRSGDKALSEPMMVSLPTHICVTRPQWVKKRPVMQIFDFSSPAAWTNCWNNRRVAIYLRHPNADMTPR